MNMSSKEMMNLEQLEGEGGKKSEKNRNQNERKEGGIRKSEGYMSAVKRSDVGG